MGNDQQQLGLPLGAGGRDGSGRGPAGLVGPAAPDRGARRRPPVVAREAAVAGTSKSSTSETRFIVQPYVLRKQRGRQAALVPADPLPVRNAQAARLRAEKLHATGRYAGVDAYP